jgi:hypothetical protein
LDLWQAEQAVSHIQAVSVALVIQYAVFMHRLGPVWLYCYFLQHNSWGKIIE